MINQVTSEFSAKFIPVNRFEVAVMVQKFHQICCRYLKMTLTTEERIEVVLMSGERSFRVVAADFNNRHPERLPISHHTVRCLISIFREIGTVANKARSGRPKSATDETLCQPQSQFLGIWKLSTWQCCVKLEVFLGAGC